MLSGSRILYLVNDAGFFLSHRLPLAKAAARAGMEVHVATPSDAATAAIRAEGFEFHPIEMRRWGGNLWHETRSFTKILRLLRRIRPDILHNVTIKPVLYGGFAARLIRQRAVVSAISGLGTVFIDPSWSGRVRRAVVRWMYRLALQHPNSGVIFQNPDDRRSFIQSGLTQPSRAVLIRGSGLDLELFRPSPLPEGPPIVMMASRLVWDKGVAEFVDSAERLRSMGVMARFVLVGEPEQGNPASVPLDKIIAWERAGIIEWWGKREDMPRVLSQALVVCLPSYREGLPKVLIEAAACGRAIIATDVPGCREVVQHERNGLLIPARNEAVLTRAIRTILEDQPRAERMGRCGRAIAEAEFAIEIVVQKTLQLYDNLLRGELPQEVLPPL